LSESFLESRLNTDLTAVMGQQAVGYDGGEKIKGRKHFTLIEALGP
jgi:hypothetical protein